MVAVFYVAPVVPAALVFWSTVLGVFGLALFIAMQVEQREARRVVLAASAIVALFGLFHRLSASVINDPALALCRSLDPNENWFLYWLYDCADLLGR